MEKLTTTITYLEMTSKPENLEIKQPANAQIIRAKNITVHFYRYLYNTVVKEWKWYERNLLNDDDLKFKIQNENVEVYVLYVDGVPAGYSELDFRNGDVNLVYFGLIPEFIGKGYGKYFLNWTVNHAWAKNTKRLWVHTCTLDAPNALDLYKKAGFVPYKTEEKEL
jgi:GNAT superfamily N-acetyltransferase